MTTRTTNFVLLIVVLVLHGSSAAQQTEKPLTNADVINMVQAGVPDSAVVSSIQSSPAKFDMSPDALLSFHKAGVSRTILHAVLTKAGSNGVVPVQGVHKQHNANPKRDASEDMDTTSKAAIKTKLEAQFTAFREQLKSVHAVKVQAESKKPPEIEALERQRALISSLRRVSAQQSATLLTSPGATATGGGTLNTGVVVTRSSNLPVGQTTSSKASGSLLSGPEPTATASKTPSVVTRGATLAGSQSTSIPANPVSRPVLATAPQLPSQQQAPTSAAAEQPIETSNHIPGTLPNVTVCTTAAIYSVNNATTGVVFTQDPAYDDYFISGRCFGNQGGEVYLSGAVTGGRINMVVKQWSSAQIEAVVQPGLTGVLDGWPDLIVVPAGGTAIKFSGNRFYAQRQTVLLPGIPQSYAHLANVQVGDGTHGFGTNYCPGPDVGHLFPCISFNAGPPLDGISNGGGIFPGPNEPVSNAVDRDGGQLQFNAGEDTYDLSSLAPGFAIDNFYASWYAWSASVCAGWQAEGSEKPGDSINYSTSGKYGFYQNGTQIVVDWGVDNCAWRWLGMFNVDIEYNSGYSLEVYVKGPIGIDPWTGHALAN